MKFKKNFKRLYFVLLSSYLFISNVIFIYHISVYGKPPGIGAVAAIFETTPQEAFEFTNLISAYELLLIIILSSVSFLIIVQQKSIEYRIKTKIYIISIVLPLLFQILIQLNDNRIDVFKHSSYILQDAKNVIYYCKEYIKLRKLRTSIKVKDFGASQQYPGNNQTHVLIIGESCSRNHMGIYGYSRNSTPKLQSRNDLEIFSNVISPTTQTRSSIARMLTETFGLNINNRGSIISIMNQIGFETYWVSNQTRYGISDTETSIIADESKNLFYLNNDWKSNSLDEKILPKLKEILRDSTNKFIIVHLIGNHFEYVKRYPQSKGFELKDNYEYFDHNTNEEKETIDEYDASIKYTDFIVNEIIEQVKAYSQFSSLLFTSDHGEDVFGNDKRLLGHGSPYVTQQTVEIPFIVWQSKAFKKYRSIKINELVKKQFYNNGNLLYSLTDLYNINFDDNDSNRSIFNHIELEKKYPFVINSNKEKIDYFRLDEN